MIPDRQIHFGFTVAAAWTLWVAVVTFMVLALTTGRDGFAYVGLACSAAAATMHMRSFLCTFSSRLKLAFDLGRQVEREKQEASRDLRSV